MWLSVAGTGWKGEELETEISKYKLVYIRWMNSKVLLYSIGN